MVGEKGRHLFDSRNILQSRYRHQKDWIRSVNAEVSAEMNRKKMKHRRSDDQVRMDLLRDITARGKQIKARRKITIVSNYGPRPKDCTEQE